MSLMAALRALVDRVEVLERTLVTTREELIDTNRRVANMFRPGKVKEVDPA